MTKITAQKNYIINLICAYHSFIGHEEDCLRLAVLPEDELNAELDYLREITEPYMAYEIEASVPFIVCETR